MLQNNHPLIIKIVAISVALSLLPSLATGQVISPERQGIAAGTKKAASAQVVDSLRIKTIQEAKYLKSIYKIDEAIDTLSSLVSSDFDEEVLAELADCHFQNGDYESAAGTYFMLSAQKPANLLYRVRQASVLYRLKAYQQAAEAGKAVLQLDSIPAILSLIGDSYNQLEQYDSALVYYNSSLARKPFNESVVNKAAKIYLGRKDYDATIGLSDAFLQIAPDNFTIAPIKGLALYLKGEYEPAVAVFESQLKLGNDSYGVHYNLGQSYWRTKTLYRAREELQAAWQIDSSDVNLAYSIAGVNSDSYMEFDRYVKPWLDKALEMLEPDHGMMSQIHQQYGLGYYKKQNAWDQAIAHYKQAYDYNPKFISALSTIAYCYEQKKDYKTALEWYEKYLKVARPGSSGYDFATQSVKFIKAELFMEEE